MLYMYSFCIYYSIQIMDHKHIYFADGSSLLQQQVEKNILKELSHYNQQELIKLLNSDAPFQSLFVDYEHPYVERLYLPGDKYRLSLHKILPHDWTIQDSLYHRHDYPTGIKIFDGMYKMESGYSPNELEPENACTSYYNSWSMYIMTDPNQWHRIKHIDWPSYSMMITGPKFRREKTNRPSKKQYPLGAERIQGLKNEFLDILQSA